jgi:hypothetical protein
LLGKLFNDLFLFVALDDFQQFAGLDIADDRFEIVAAPQTKFIDADPFDLAPVFFLTAQPHARTFLVLRQD